MLKATLKLLAICFIFFANVDDVFCCVDVDKYMSEYCQSTSNDSKIRKEKIFDLDGDKLKDSIVACNSLCGASGNCNYKIFISNKGCSKQVGEVNGVIKKVLKTKSNGLNDITQFYKNGCVGRAGVWSHLKYNKEKYITSRSVECKCKDIPSRPEECPSW